LRKFTRGLLYFLVSEGVNKMADKTSPDTRTDTRRGVMRWLFRESMGLVTLAVLLFLSAGRLDWVMGWAFFGVMALWVAATGLVVMPRNPALLAERLGPKKGSKTWDTAILGVWGLTTMARFILAGLDVRYGWTTGLSLPIQIAALVVMALGYALVVWATASNAFFSLVVRIQTERGHAVATGGPYRYVRHPAYVGGILIELLAPIALGSAWALIPDALAVVLFVVRTALEDRTLLAELKGYDSYARQVRYRLLPGVW
jgi:protein-S-isoprenylcysteine O-methyltransferase Ste14